MAKINLKGFPKHLHEAITKTVDEVLSPKNLKDIGDDLAEQIRVRTRLGNGLDDNGGEPSKLKPLSNVYVEQRKRMDDLSSLTTPKKSNLTRTGQMLNDLEAKVSNDRITLTFKEQSSKDKARWVSENDRPFLAISRVQIQRLKNDLQSKIVNLLKKYL